MTDVLGLHPEVDGLIREVAKRPDSVLLRTSPSVLAAWEESPVLHETESGLSLAERHLVSVYREEAAFALRDLARAKLTATSTRGARLILRQTVSASAPLADARNAAITASRALNETPHVILDPEGRALLESGVDLRGASRLSVVHLCTAAQRLAPTWNARLMIAQALLFEDRREAAFVAAVHALQSAPSSVARGITWSQLAEISAQSGRWSDARRAAREALECHPELLSGHLAEIWASVQQADEPAAGAGFIRLTSLVANRHDALNDHERRFVTLSVLMRSSLSPAALVVLRRLVDRSPLAGRLFHAFFS